MDYFVASLYFMACSWASVQVTGIIKLGISGFLQMETVLCGSLLTRFAFLLLNKMVLKKQSTGIFGKCPGLVIREMCFSWQ